MKPPPLILAPPDKIRRLAQLRAEKKRRDEAKRNRWATAGQLAKAIDPTIVQTPALDLIDEAVNWALSTPGARLIISVPPQEGKSERVTKTGALLALTRNPDTRIGIISYGQSLAETFSRDIRNRITANNGDQGTLDLGLKIAADNGAVARWQLAGHRGGVTAAGLRTSITGRPLELLIIDDPVANREQAKSAYFRELAWDWWTSVGSTRLAPDAPVILVLTRWHEDDLAGRFTKAEDGHRWRVINIPAQADHDPAKGQSDPLGREPGEWLESARRRTRAQWEEIRIQAGIRDFTSLYQGRPSPDAGDVWERGWWRYYTSPLWTQHPAVPEAWLVDADELVISVDCAFKDTKSSDYVVMQVWARRGANVYLLEQVRKRLSFTATITALTAFCNRWPQATRKLVEDKANGTAVIDQLKSKIPGLVAINPTDSKYGRAVAVAPVIESGNVLLPDKAIGLFDPEELVTEAAAFPNDAHDDQVDATSQALAAMLLDGTGAQAWIAWIRRKAEQIAAAAAGQQPPGGEAAPPGDASHDAAPPPQPQPEPEPEPEPEPLDPVAARKAARTAAYQATRR